MRLPLLGLAVPLACACSSPGTTNVYVINQPGADAAALEDTLPVDSGTDTFVPDTAGDAGVDAAPSGVRFFEALDGLTMTPLGVSLLASSEAAPIVSTRTVPMVGGKSPTTFFPTMPFAAYGSTTCVIDVRLIGPDGWTLTWKIFPAEDGPKVWEKPAGISAAGHTFGGTVTMKAWGSGCGPGATLFLGTATLRFEP